MEVLIKFESLSGKVDRLRASKLIKLKAKNPVANSQLPVNALILDQYTTYDANLFTQYSIKNLKYLQCGSSEMYNNLVVTPNIKLPAIGIFTRAKNLTYTADNHLILYEIDPYDTVTAIPINHVTKEFHIVTSYDILLDVKTKSKDIAIYLDFYQADQYSQTALNFSKFLDEDFPLIVQSSSFVRLNLENSDEFNHTLTGFGEVRLAYPKRDEFSLKNITALNLLYISNDRGLVRLKKLNINHVHLTYPESGLIYNDYQDENRYTDNAILPVINTVEVEANAKATLGQFQIYDDLHINVGASVTFPLKVDLGDEEEQKGLNINIDFVDGKANTDPYLDFTQLSLTDLPPTIPIIILSKVPSNETVTKHPDFPLSCYKANGVDKASDIKTICDLSAQYVKDVAKNYAGKCKTVNSTTKVYCVYATYDPTAYPTEATKGLSGLEIALIIVAAVILLACIGVIVYCCCFSSKGKKKGGRKDLGNDKYVNKTEEEI